MKPTYKWMVVLVFLGLLIGCDQQKPAKKDPQIEQLEQTIEQQKIAGDLQAIHQAYTQSQSATYQGEFKLELEDQVLTRQSRGQENYQEGALTEGLVTNTLQVQDHKWHEAFYHQGDKEYYQGDGKTWQASSHERLPDFFMVYMNFILGGNDLYQRQENRVEKSITDPDQLANLATYLDWPVAFTKDASYDLKMGLTFDPENNEVKGVDIVGQVEDQNRTYKIDQSLQVTLSKDPQEMTVNLNEGPKPLQYEADQFLEAFKAADQTAAIFTYTLNGRAVSEGHEEEWLIYQNVIGEQPIYTTMGRLEDDDLVDYEQVDPKGDSDLKAYALHNTYRYFVETFIEDYEDLEVIEAPDESEQPATETYRWMSDDQASFKDKVGDLDVSFLEREDEAAYGIEYLVNPQTLRLEGVVVWSAPVDQTTVENVLVLNFFNFNQFNPNNLVAMVEAPEPGQDHEETTEED